MGNSKLIGLQMQMTEMVAMFVGLTILHKQIFCYGRSYVKQIEK